MLREVAPAVKTAQEIMLHGLNDNEAVEFLRHLQKTTFAINELRLAPLKETIQALESCN